jgi:hypothetical protein
MLDELCINCSVDSESEKHAIEGIMTSITYASTSQDGKLFTFTIRDCSLGGEGEKDVVACVTLRVIKGSIFTYIWNTLARFDDEYELSVKFVNDDCDQKLWHVCGIDPFNAKISKGTVDWTNFRRLQELLCARNIGLQSFSRIFTRMVLLLPNSKENICFLAPMPVTFM